jgi:hypothetical protein
MSDVIGVMLLAASGGLFGDRPDESTADRVARLVKQLGDEDFAKREAASKELNALGAPALAALRKAAADGDPEVRRRSAMILGAITGRVRAAAARKDLEKLQGTWYTVSTNHNGTATGEDRTDTITYEGTEFVQRRNGEEWAAGTIAIVDATASPK